MRYRRKYIAFLLCATFGTIWLLVSIYTVPPIIESAYYGKSSSLFNSFISGQHVNPLEYYQTKWKRTSQGLLAILIASAVPFVLIVRNWRSIKERLHGFPTIRKIPKPLYFNTIIVISLFGFIICAYYYFPVAYVYLIVEDGWIEFSTFITMLTASLILLLALMRHKDLRKPATIIIALLAFVVGMEEISWGQRLFGFSTPAYIYDVNLQGEANIHNFVDSMNSNVIMGFVVFFWCIPLYVLFKSFGNIAFGMNKLGVPVPDVYLWPFFIISSILLIFQLFNKSAEIGELFFGIGFGALAIHVWMAKEINASIRDAVESIATLLMIMYVVLCAGILVYFFSPTDHAKALLNSFASEHLPAEGMYVQADKIFDYLSKNPDYIDIETTIARGRLLLAKGRSSEATRVLASALVELEDVRNQKPNDTTAIRNMAIVLKMLNRSEQSQSVFQEALKEDNARLDEARSRIEKIKIQMSMYTTYLEMEDCDKASEQMSVIRSLRPPAYYIKKAKRVMQDSACH